MFLEQATPSDDKEDIERLFLPGRIEMRFGLPREAIERFETILVFRPGLSPGSIQSAEFDGSALSLNQRT